MTREEILAMKPGRELDALVGKTFEFSPRIMWYAMNKEETSYYMDFGSQLLAESWHNEQMARFPHGWYVEDGGHIVRQEIYRHYSEDISAAWEVLRAFGYYKIEVSGAMGPDCIEVFAGSEPMRYSKAEAIEAPEAICKAALLAVMEER